MLEEVIEQTARKSDPNAARTQIRLHMDRIQKDIKLQSDPSEDDSAESQIHNRPSLHALMAKAETSFAA